MVPGDEISGDEDDDEGDEEEEVEWAFISQHNKSRW